MENLNDILGYKGLKIYQNSDFFSFSLDSVMLANFVSLNIAVKNILDLGCGNGVIPLILSRRCSSNIDGVEIQNSVFELAKKNIKVNNLESRINIINTNMKSMITEKYIEKYDVITANPPYFPITEGTFLSQKKEKMIARHEVEITVSEIVEIASKLLKNRGRFAMVCRGERFTEVIALFQKNKIEPKRIRNVFNKPGQSAVLFLIEGIKGGKPGLKIEYPLVLYDEYGNILDEYADMLVEVKK